MGRHKRSESKEKEVVIGVKVPVSLREQFTTALEKSDITQAQLIRAWIRDHVEKYEARQKQAA